MDLSVIIVSYNVRHFLEQCLNSVSNAAEKIDCEIFVVDNNSGDGTCRMIKRQFPHVILIENRDNKGFAAANNQALAMANGNFILLLNPDTIIEEDAFTKCISFLLNHPDAGAVGVKMINGKGILLPESKRAFPAPRTAFFKVSGLSFVFPKSRLFNHYYLGHLDNNKTTKADILTGAFMFLRREAFMKTGYLDEDFFMYGEDIDYSFRLKLAGYNNYYYPDVKILHFKGESTRKEDIEVIKNFYKAMLIFVDKHFSNGHHRLIILPIYAAIYFRASLSVIKRSLKKLFKMTNGTPPGIKHKAIVISDQEGYTRVKELISESGPANKIAGRVSLLYEEGDNELLGDIEQVREIIASNDIREVIFTLRELSCKQMISCMQLISDMNPLIRIASPGERYLTGSKYVYPRSEID